KSRKIRTSVQAWACNWPSGTPRQRRVQTRGASATLANQLVERDSDGPRQSAIDGEEVAVVGTEVAGGGLIRRPDLRRAEAVTVGVGDQRVPVGIDVELHRSYRPRTLQDSGQGD